MKVLLLQLPVPNSALSNLPLALGYLKASLDQLHLPDLEVAVMGRDFQDKSGDAFLLDAILAHNPDVVGFSLYTWNSQRALRLARHLKQIDPQLITIAGGPEVNRDNDFVLSQTALDFLVLGEGEHTFAELITLIHSGRSNLTPNKLQQVSGIGYQVSGFGHSSTIALPHFRTSDSSLILHPSSFIFTPPRTAIEDVNLVPSAYLGGTLNGHLGKFMAIELSRWCPSKCTFCYYGRQDLPRGGKRYFELGRLRAELEYGLAHGVEQVHFVEANFNTLPHLPQIYQLIKDLGATRQMRFYAEMRAEAIDPAEAEELARCGFSVVECGLQSAVPEVLAKVRRKNHLPKLVQGVHNLRAQGIEVYLDAILGLPGDTPATYRQTLDFIESHDLAPYDMFHLQILSGTQLKNEISDGQHGIKYQAEPPYFVTETADLSFEQLCEVRRETLLRKGDDPAEIPGLPQPSVFALCQIENNILTSQRDQPIERVIIDGSRPADVETNSLNKLARRLASAVTVWLRNIEPSQAVQVLYTLSRPNPSGVWHIVVETQQPLDAADRQRILDSVYHETGYLDSLAIFAYGQPDPQKYPSPSVQLYNLVNGANLADEPDVITRLDFAPDDTADQWRQVLATAPGECDLYLCFPADAPLAKIQAALEGFDPGSRRLWWQNWEQAAGYAAATDLPLDYPLTQTPTGLYQPTPTALSRAALQWELTRRQLV